MQTLRDQGVEVSMLTGDNSRTAAVYRAGRLSAKRGAVSVLRYQLITLRTVAVRL